ncbi:MULTISPECIES: Uma2 family endonuclease [Streptomyces]|uniref:Uma2 family endonuclease n=1 Tax=Streptomyces TaxID=1883 RepID=UPI000B9EDCAC|nr:Uma2 family endonuclease [Streptomyces kasugaensis]
MSALTVDHVQGYGHEWDDLVRIWEETDAPEGCKVEIIEGIVTVSPPPDGMHNDIAEELHAFLRTAMPKEWGWGVYQQLGLALPSRDGLYIPDVVVAPKTLVRSETTGCVPAAATELVVEITSKSNAAHDRIGKLAGYALADVPLYLLIDRFAPGGPTITLYGEPKSDVYRTLSAVKFGEQIHLPKPFDVTIDTDTFLAD